VDLVVDFLELLEPNIIVHRLSGETYRAITVAPDWSIDKIGVHNAIFKAFESRDTWQGRVFPVSNEISAAQMISSSSQGAIF
jgi:radical SAM superfamily enzyme